MVSAESEWIERMRPLATHPAARRLLDDAAVLAVLPGRELVITKDLLAEGVHYLASDPPADVAWKLVAVNLSDLAAKGAAPLGVLLGYPIGGGAWDAAFADGFAAVLSHWDVPLLGGDTIRVAGPRALSLTALGTVPAGGAPSRTGARAGDNLWVTGAIGWGGLGLRRALEGAGADDPAVARYRRPEPRLAAGQALAPLASAMCDVSDGLLIDAARIAAASGLAVAIDLRRVPLASGLAAIEAVTAGDDYELLFAADRDRSPMIEGVSQRLGLTVTRIGRFVAGAGLSLGDESGPVPLPASLGYEHAPRDRTKGDGD